MKGVFVVVNRKYNGLRCEAARYLLGECADLPKSRQTRE